MKYSNRGEEPLKPDLCVIGAGAAGLSVASVAASLGVSVVLVEKGRMGGECLNVGCVPSKALIAAARRAATIRQAGAFGIGAGEPVIDAARVFQHVRETIAAIAPVDSASRYRAMGVTVIEAEARFTGAHTLLAGGRIVQARRFVIATGSRPAVPPIPGIESIPFLTNESLFDLSEIPGHLVVLGGGAIGVEMAQAFRRLGADVTMIEAGERLLAREDAEMAAAIDRFLRREGVAVKLGAAVERVEPQPGGFALVAGGERIEGTHLLVATGRRPVVEGLGLEEAGVKADASGILVDKGLKTTNRRIYAIGDCAGGAVAARFTHGANHQAGLVIRSALFRLPVRAGRAPMPRVLYADPELAAVGLTEEEARERHGFIRILRFPFAANDRAEAEGETAGHVKAIVTPRGRILGCAILGPHAGELIMPWVLAMTRGLRVSDLAGLIYPYPTFSEVTKAAAVEFLKTSAQNRFVRGLVRFLRLWG